MHPLRIISLLPSATEILFAVGAGDYVVGVTHECDFPPAATVLPHCTGSLLAPGLTAAEIDKAVSASLLKDEHSIYSLNRDMLRSLRPTHIITQSLCAVCAVPETTVQSFACSLPGACRVISSDPHTVTEILLGVGAIAQAVGCSDGGIKVMRNMEMRIRKVKELVQGKQKKRVMVVEWPDPVYAGGHWVPEMVEMAGGVSVMGKKGEKSERVGWDQVESIIENGVDVVICAFCGYDLKENEREWEKVMNRAEWRGLKNATIVATNASAMWSRPGNRVILGIETLAYVMYRMPQYKPEAHMVSVYQSGQWRDLGLRAN